MRSTRRRWPLSSRCWCYGSASTCTAKIIVVFLFAIFPILINTYQGVRECDKNIIEVARSFRVSEVQMWTHVLLPWSVPFITAGIGWRSGAASSA